MNRMVFTTLSILSFTFVELAGFCQPPAFASTVVRRSSLSANDKEDLLRYATDTWRSFEVLAQPSGLPADYVSCEGEAWGSPSIKTTPTNIACYLWSVLAAERLKLISKTEATSRLAQTLGTLARMERYHGFFLNDLDARTGTRLKISPVDASTLRPLVSSVDNAWLAAALLMVVNTQPTLRDRASKLLQPMDFSFFYDAYDRSDPVRHPGLLRVGYWADNKSFYAHYGMLNSEARIISYLGIALGQLPPEHYFRMFRTLPDRLGSQEQVPTGVSREYLGIKVFEGSYTYRGLRIVPSWGGSMAEALMSSLFVPEEAWAPRSWGVNNPLYARAQIEHGLAEAGYGYWGFSPAKSPKGRYRVYGVKSLGTWPEGYLSYDMNGIVPEALQINSTPRFSHGVVTPHAAFLGLRYAPREAMDNLHAQAASFPIYGPLGFHDSVDVSAGVVSGCVIAVDQGMIMAAIANELDDDYMRHAFSDGAVEQKVRPLIAMEQFSASPVRQTAQRKLKTDPLQTVRVRIK